MIDKVHPRLRMFVERLFLLIVVYLAITGLFAIVRGEAKGPDLWWCLSVFIGATLGAMIGKVPARLLPKA